VHGQSTVKRGRRARPHRSLTREKCRFDGDNYNSAASGFVMRPLVGTRAVLRWCGVQRGARERRAMILRTRFLNREDVFFLSAVVIENAVPTIRVGADATSPLGSD
jgi:hypothetical protein